MDIELIHFTIYAVYYYIYFQFIRKFLYFWMVVVYM